MPKRTRCQPSGLERLDSFLRVGLKLLSDARPQKLRSRATGEIGAEVDGAQSGGDSPTCSCFCAFTRFCSQGCVPITYGASGVQKDVLAELLVSCDAPS